MIQRGQFRVAKSSEFLGRMEAFHVQANRDLTAKSIRCRFSESPQRAAYSYRLKLCRFGLLERNESPVHYRFTQEGRERLICLGSQL